MLTKIMTVEEIIKSCGGEHEVAYRLHFANIYIVRRWYRTGIPLRHWQLLILMAESKGVRLTGEMLWAAVENLIKE